MIHQGNVTCNDRWPIAAQDSDDGTIIFLTDLTVQSIYQLFAAIKLICPIIEDHQIQFHQWDATISYNSHNPGNHVQASCTPAKRGSDSEDLDSPATAK